MRAVRMVCDACTDPPDVTRYVRKGTETIKLPIRPGGTHDSLDPMRSLRRWCDGLSRSAGRRRERGDRNCKHDVEQYDVLADARTQHPVFCSASGKRFPQAGGGLAGVPKLDR